MTALMMATVTNRLIIKSGRLINLLFLFIIFNCSKASEHSTRSAVIKKNVTQHDKVKSDSLEITLKNIPAKTDVSLIYNDKNLNTAYINFENKSNNNQSITKKISKVTDFNYTLRYRSFSTINNKLQTHYHDYFVDRATQKIELIFNDKNGDIELKNHDGNVLIYDDIYNSYQEITSRKNRIKPAEKILQIEKLHSDYQKKFNDVARISINDLVFYSQLSLLSPNDKKIENYLENISSPLWSNDLLGLVSQYLKTKKENIYQLNLNKSKNDIYNDLIELGVGWHLQQYKEQKYASYNKNVEWFKNTPYYSKNKETLDKVLQTDNKQKSIKDDLLSFDIYKEDKVTKLESAISGQKSEYYLLDFWATWCAPCLQNIEAIHSMDLPQGLEIISISMDRTSNREKWAKKSEDFKLANSYLFVESQNNKNIIKKISLNQLPRYILIDKNFNVLNPNLPTPQEADFLKELKIYIKKQ